MGGTGARYPHGAMRTGRETRVFLDVQHMGKVAEGKMTAHFVAGARLVLAVSNGTQDELVQAWHAEGVGGGIGCEASRL